MENTTAKGKSTQRPKKKEESEDLLRTLNRPGKAAVLLLLKQVGAVHARMTEYANKSNEEMASEFITSTCQMLPKSYHAVSDHMQDYMMSFHHEPNPYLLLCGSAVEFYIRPLNTCIDDIDYLMSRALYMAFNDDYPLLPRDRSGLADSIRCFKIETYDGYPGFVRLRDLGKMNYNWKSKKYEFSMTDPPNTYVHRNMDNIANMYPMTHKRSRQPNVVSGPAIKYGTDKVPCFLGKDLVFSIWCHQWPEEAKGWLKRPRNNGWPTTDTIAEVAQNGCHVVYVQHRSCRDDQHQWRLSFSFAEIILIQSWTKTQQIVYHLLRFFAKRELIQKDCPKEGEVLCPYHLKTLMLWTCEEMSPEWWNSSSIIALCCELLKKLSEWLKRRHCPNYFIRKANLIHEPSSSKVLENTKRRLNEFMNSEVLCQWFIENYILPITPTHFEVESTLKKAQHFVNFMLHLFEFWKVNETKTIDSLFSLAFIYTHNCCRSVIEEGCCTGLRVNLKDGYSSRCFEPKVNSRLIDLPTLQNVLCFKYHDIVLHILHTAYGLGCGEISWDRGPSLLFVEFVDAISMKPNIIRSQYHNFPKTYTEQSSWFQFLRALDLMQNLTGSNSRPEFQLLSLMSKEFLRKALEYDDSKNSGIAPAALAYLAALHFVTSEYQQAIRFCFAVLVDQTSQMDKETLNAGCLFFIDDVTRIVGFCILQKKITDNNLQYINRRLYLDLRISPEVFALYLAVLSAERTSNRFDFYRDFPDSVFPMDKFFKALTKSKCIASMQSGTQFNAFRQIVYCRTDSLTETKATDMNPLIGKETVIDVLMEYALENMTSFYNVINKDFGIQCNTVDCYRALHLYKCRKYHEVLDLCERILQEPDLGSDLKEFAFANGLLVPPFDSFFDGDVQSLLGFHTLFYYLSPLNDDIGNVELTDESTFEHWFFKNVNVTGNSLSCFLHYRYSCKRHYFLGRHFLARYLKVRCCVDCNYSYSEALTDFAAQQTNHPFEHIIRCFLLQKLRI